MRHITVALLIPSQVMTLGLTNILRKMQDVDFSFIELNGENTAAIGNVKPSIIIADPLACNTDWLEGLRNGNPTMRVLGLVHTPLPQFVQKHYDDTVSIYDTANMIIQTVKKNVTVEESDMRGKDLSPREKEVIVGIVKGLSNKEIASEMNVSVNTVMTHRRNIASKLHIHTPAGLTIYAIVSNLVRIEDIKEGVSGAN